MDKTVHKPYLQYCLQLTLCIRTVYPTRAGAAARVHCGHTEQLSAPWHSVDQTWSLCTLWRQSTYTTRQSRGLPYTDLSLQKLYNTLEYKAQLTPCSQVQVVNLHFPVKSKACARAVQYREGLWKHSRHHSAHIMSPFTSSGLLFLGLTTLPHLDLLF